MKQVIKLFIPSIVGFKNVAKEAKQTSISRERFIDFIKVVGLLMITFNTEYLLDFRNSGGELLVYNESFTISHKTRFTWFTTGISLFFFSTGFTNKIAWYSNVGRDGSQWKFLTDRVNSLMGPVFVVAKKVFLSMLEVSEFSFRRFPGVRGGAGWSRVVRWGLE